MLLHTTTILTDYINALPPQTICKEKAVDMVAHPMSLCSYNPNIFAQWGHPHTTVMATVAAATTKMVLSSTFRTTRLYGLRSDLSWRMHLGIVG